MNFESREMAEGESACSPLCQDRCRSTTGAPEKPMEESNKGYGPHCRLFRVRTVGTHRMEVIMEKREYIRKDSKSLVDFATRGWTYLRSIDNISAGGMFIRTRDIIEPGEELYMRFSLEGKRHDLKGTVARTAANGIGVRFLSEGIKDKSTPLV